MPFAKHQKECVVKEEEGRKAREGTASETKQRERLLSNGSNRIDLTAAANYPAFQSADRYLVLKSPQLDKCILGYLGPQMPTHRSTKLKTTQDEGQINRGRGKKDSGDYTANHLMRLSWPNQPSSHHHQEAASQDSQQDHTKEED